MLHYDYSIYLYVSVLIYAVDFTQW